MKIRLLNTTLLPLIVGVGSTFAQNGPSPDRPRENKRDQVRIQIPRDANLPTDVQQLVNQFREGRDALLAERRALLASLGDASEAEVRAALDELRESHRAEIETQRELARQLRKELRQLRRDRAGPPDGEG